MSSFKYDGTRVNSAVDAINQISSQFSSLSTSIRSATNQIVSARGFQQYVGGLSSDTFSGAIDQCGAEIVDLSRSIRQKEVSILAYSQDSQAIGSFLNHLTNKEYQSLDLAELSPYIGFARKTGNFVTGVGASALTLGLGVVEGVADFGETLVDTAALGLTGAASIFTGIYDFFTGSNTTERMWENTKAFVSEKRVENAFDRFYNNNSFGQFLQQNAYGFDAVRGIGKGLGYTAGVIGLTAVTGGLAAGGIGSAGSITAGNLATTAGVLGFGNGTEEAWADGATLGKGLLYGAAAGAWEGAQWFAGAKINQFGGVGDQVAKGIFKGASSGVGTRIFMDTVDSGLEGFVQPALTMIYKDYGGANFVENYKTAFSAAGGWGNVATQAAIGAIGSTIGEISGARKLLKEANQAGPDVNGKEVAGGVATAESADQIFKTMGGDAEGVKLDLSDSMDDAARLAADTADDAASTALKKGEIGESVRPSDSIGDVGTAPTDGAGDVFKSSTDGSSSGTAVTSASAAASPSDASRLSYVEKNGKGAYVDSTTGGRYPIETRMDPGSKGYKHIFEGEIDAKGKADGFHYEASLRSNRPNIQVTTVTAADAHGVYVGQLTDVSTGSVLKDKTTFFPTTWSESKICEAVRNIGGSFPEAVNFKKQKALYHGFFDGIEIVVIKNNGGDVISAYPLHMTETYSLKPGYTRVK